MTLPGFALLDDPSLRAHLLGDRPDRPAALGTTSPRSSSSRLDTTTSRSPSPRESSSTLGIPTRPPFSPWSSTKASCDTFRGSTQESVQGSRRGRWVDPGVAAQLTDIGQVASFAPHPIGDVIIPGERLSALLAGKTSPRPSKRIADRAPSEPAIRERGRPRQGRAHGFRRAAAPVDNPAGQASHPRTASDLEKSPPRLAVPPARRSNEPASPAPRPSHAIAGGQPVIVLVWVSHTRSG